jgi:probable rRNA maturation factor
MSHVIDFRKSSRSTAMRRAPLERLSRAVVRQVLDGEGLVDAEMGVWFVDDPEIQRLNREHRGVDRATDVIAFHLSSPEERKQRGVLLGDVVISLPAARRQADEQGHSVEVETVLLLIHGALHLLGYDHQGDREADRMRAREIHYLRKTGFKPREIDRMSE